MLLRRRADQCVNTPAAKSGWFQPKNFPKSDFRLEIEMRGCMHWQKWQKGFAWPLARKFLEARPLLEALLLYPPLKYNGIQHYHGVFDKAGLLWHAALP
jgi:hypothetical protein